MNNDRGQWAPAGYEAYTMEVGDTFPVLKGLGKTYKAHIVAIVDRNMIVYKWYGRHKQWWHYDVEHIDVIKGLIEYFNQRE